MRLKVIDAAWVADKALDEYAAAVIGNEREPSFGRSECLQSSVGASAAKLFDSVYKRAVDGYSSRFDKTVAIVSCFPMMRVADCGVMTRYVCGNKGFLRGHGISPSQFLDHFERFVQRKCNCGAMTEDGNCVWLKDKAVSYGEWREAILGCFGSSLCDFERDGVFASNPGFVTRFVADGCEIKPLGSLSAFRIRKIVEKIALT